METSVDKIQPCPKIINNLFSKAKSRVPMEDNFVYQLDLLKHETRRFRRENYTNAIIIEFTERHLHVIDVLINTYLIMDKPSYRALRNLLNSVFDPRNDTKGLFLQINNLNYKGPNGAYKMEKIDIS